uniref:Uncharacterized protein n=1 Tax=Anguilla anguilla TaxID=7936 RepID=A0A0E9VTP9_ANGAN
MAPKRLAEGIIAMNLQRTLFFRGIEACVIFAAGLCNIAHWSFAYPLASQQRSSNRGNC